MSITLTNPINITQGASTLESDPAAAIMAISSDYTLHGGGADPIDVITIKSGTVNGLSLVPGPIEGNSSIQVSINLTTGAWASTNGLNGVLSGAQLTAIQNSEKTRRNAGEALLIALGIVSGTQVAW